MKTKIILALLVTALFASCSNVNKASEQKTETEQTMPVAEPTAVVFHVEGMTCDHCEESIQKGVNELQGINLVEANHEDSTTKVIYDPSKTDLEAIKAAIEKRGYTASIE